MNPIESILVLFSVVNVPLAAAAVLSVPNDVSAVDAALVPHIADPALRASCAARIVNQRAAAVVPPVLPPAPAVGAALLPVAVPAAPALAWVLPPAAAPVVVPPPVVVAPVTMRTPWVLWVILGFVAALFCLSIYWVLHGAEEQTATAVISTVAGVKTETDKVSVKTDAISVKADGLKTSTDALIVKTDALKVTTDNVVTKVDDIKLVADATSVKVDGLKTSTDALNVKADALKADLASARRALRYAITTRATPADISAAEARMTTALKAIKIQVEVRPSSK